VTTPTQAGVGAPRPAETHEVIGTGSRFTRVLGVVALLMLAVQLALALWISPPEVLQGQAVRLFYLHVPLAIAGGYLGVGLLAVGSIGYLWKRTIFWDLLAASAGELALVFTGLTLLTGSLWGRPVWGTYWEWDPRLTLTAVLFVLLIGYRAMRSATLDPQQRARRSAVIGLLAAADVPLIRLSVDWWRGLHQDVVHLLLLDGDLQRGVRVVARPSVPGGLARRAGGRSGPRRRHRAAPCRRPGDPLMRANLS